MKKVAIVNRTNLINFGSVLQVFALSEAVKFLGYYPEVIWEAGTLTSTLDLRPKKIFSILLKLLRYPKFIPFIYKDVKYVSQVKFSPTTISMFNEFIEKNINRRYYNPKEFNKIGKSEIYYKYICGSDQVWCSTTLYPDPLMYLRFADKEKRIAYAPSFGRSYIPDYNKRVLRKYISGIPSISVRETLAKELIKQLIGIDAPVVLDPTLLFDKDFWRNLATSINQNNYILCYFLNEPSINVQKEILRYANGKKIIGLHSEYSHIVEKSNNLFLPDAGPEEFLGYIENADFIFTDSYHGMIFSINFEKDFLSVERDYGDFDQSTRQKSILELLDMSDRYNTTGVVSSKPIDYAKVQNKLQQLRTHSLKYLRTSLNS